MKKLIRNVGAVLLSTSMLISCGGGSTEKNETTPADKKVEEKVEDKKEEVPAAAGEHSKDIYIVLKTLGGAYWGVVEKGARDAAEELGYNAIVTGVKNETEIEIQKNLMADAISSKPAAIIFAPVDSKALASSVTDAKEAGLPIVLVDTLVTNEDYSTAFSTNNVNAGKEAAVQMIKHLKARGVDESKEGQIAIQKGADTQTILDRLEGFRAEWANSAPEAWTIAEDSILIAKDAEEAFNQGVNALTNDKIIGVFGTNNGPSVGWARALEDQGRDDIVAVTFDYSAEVAKLIKDGKFDITTIVQKQYYMGYEGVKAAIDILNGKEPAQKLNDTGVLAVDKENVENDDVKAIVEAGN